MDLIFILIAMSLIFGATYSVIGAFVVPSIVIDNNSEFNIKQKIFAVIMGGPIVWGFGILVLLLYYPICLVGYIFDKLGD
jgi:hypothetical protein